jgi:nicotinamidase-related amidase
VTEDPRHLAGVAELLGLLLRSGPDHVTQCLLERESPEVRAEAGRVADAFAAQALALEPAELAKDEAGRDPLKARILQSLAAADARKSALLVIDMLNDHLTPGGPLEVPRARDIVPAMKAQLAEARAKGVPVVYVVDHHDADDPDLDVWTTHNVAGSHGGEVWPELAPLPGERVVTKPTYSAFTASKLEEVLDELGVDRLVLTGCLTDMGVLATALDALQRGFDVVVPKETQAGSGEAQEAAALATLAMMPPFVPAQRARRARNRARAGRGATTDRA